MSVIEAQGIILKTFFPTKRVMAVLDAQQGKIVCVPDTERVCVGALMTYQMHKRLTTLFAQRMETIAVPFELARHDLLFYHHVLELCYYFMPLDSVAPDVFALVRQLCFLDKQYFSYQYKIVFLVRLFLLFGMQTEVAHQRWPRITQLFATGVDSVVIATIDLETLREMHEWLHGCLAHHPLLAQFKTLHFLKDPEMETI